MCALGRPYTEGTVLYCDYFMWCVSCTVVVLTGFVMCVCVCVCVCVRVCVGLCVGGWVCVCVSFVMCGCIGNMCPCIYCVLCCLYCVLYCLYYVFVSFRLCIFILICFVCTSLRTTATE